MLTNLKVRFLLTYCKAKHFETFTKNYIFIELLCNPKLLNQNRVKKFRTYCLKHLITICKTER